MKEEKMAVIGIAAKFPGADNIYQYWANLCGKVDSAGEFPESRIHKLEEYIKKNRSESCIFKKGAYLDDISNFDYKYFKIPKVEAIAMSPHQRLFLQTAVSAMEDAGYGGKKLYSKKIGVYVGNIGDNELVTYQNILDGLCNKMSSTGALSSNIAGRLSYFMDFTGPSILVDSACSSSMAALKAACQGIEAGDCEAAIVGAVQLSIFPEINTELGIEAMDGHTRPFDQFSKGTGLGEGIAALMVKPYKEAQNDGDHIYCIIRSIVGNQDGRSVGLSAPNPQAQTKLIKESLDKAKISVDDVSYLELHGTGTKLGDPIEFKALEDAFASRNKEEPNCYIGSVKANIGHLFACSGLAGIIKCCMMLQCKKIAPQINFTEVNHQIDLQKSLFKISNGVIDWKTNKYKRFCGVSNFGFSGTNYHVVLEEADEVKESKSNKYEIFILSAMNREPLENSVKQYIKFLKLNKNLSLADICYTLSTGRGHYNFRLAIICSSIEELICKLGEFDYYSDFEKGIYYTCVNKITDRRIKPRFGDITRGTAFDIGNHMKKIMKQVRLSGIHDLYERLCMLYINGGDNSWDTFYEERHLQRVSLPTYNFEKMDCWPVLQDC